jgi:arsenate reductase-like glutaredoxin family protein
LEANKIDVKEQIPASRKLSLSDAKKLLKSASSLTVAKGKKVTQFKAADLSTKAAAESMLGPTGNLRAPTIVMGKRLIVGFNQELFEEMF